MSAAPGGSRRKSRKNKGGKKPKKTMKRKGGRRHRKSRKNKGGGDPIPGVDVSIEQTPSGIIIGNVTVPGPIRILIPGKLVQKPKTF